MFISIYVRCQDVLLDNMKLGPNIARNAALRENVFMMAICIELRIPLFLVSKPGSSKSLAKSIVAASMLGRFSEGKLMKKFKEVDDGCYVYYVSILLLLLPSVFCPFMVPPLFIGSHVLLSMQSVINSRECH